MSEIKRCRYCYGKYDTGELITPRHHYDGVECPGSDKEPLARPFAPPARDRDWKPEVGEKVLVVDEATFERMEDDTIAVVRWADGRYSLVPLSSIHPMTGRDGNSKRKE